MQVWEGGGSGIDWNPHALTAPRWGSNSNTPLISAVFAVLFATSHVAGRYDFLIDYLRDPMPLVIAARGALIVWVASFARLARAPGGPPHNDFACAQPGESRYSVCLLVVCGCEVRVRFRQGQS